MDVKVSHPRDTQPPGAAAPNAQAQTFDEARRQLRYELVSGLSGVVLAVFMWGHMVLVGSILTGARGFDWVATMLENYFIAQPTIVVVFILFLVHAAMASRKIPAQLKERRRMLALARDLRSPALNHLPVAARDPRLNMHLESLLWIWQVRTGMVILVLGSFHLLLIGLDVFTPLFGTRTGIEAASTIARDREGLWLLYAVLLLCVEFHACVGLYRFAVKWGASAWLSVTLLRRVAVGLFVIFFGTGVVVLMVIGGLIKPPLAFLLGTVG